MGGRITLIAIAALLAAGAASCDPKPHIAPSPTPSVTFASRPPPVGDNVRYNALAVPPGAKAHDMGFVDADTGYVLFTHCAGGCEGVLFVTFDGGRTWLKRTLPTVERAELLQITMIDNQTMLYTAQPSGWYRSSDAGHTFVPGGPGPATAPRGVTTGCPTDAPCAGQVLIDGAPAPAQPTLPGQLRAAAKARRAATAPIWAVSANGTTLYTARSVDAGRTWQPFGQPRVLADASAIELQVSTDGADTWLITGPGTGHVAVYIAEATAWRPVVPELVLGSSRATAAAAGLGVLALGGDDFGFLRRDGRWQLWATPRVAPRVTALDDGTLFVSLAPDDVWIGTGTGADRTWAHVTVEPAS